MTAVIALIVVAASVAFAHYLTRRPRKPEFEYDGNAGIPTVGPED